ncbi:hypothetical protein K3N28_11570 [Glycomyces sp. TRM65418]|uniref:hypothetical protein n=1 Tax=Glycomyces sp. TRM65418 TaxID=2867006 RepID=UPI001CE6CCF9|nr:hypothetical protein [Glycomyces sp. TRM65418]MCC3763708.1 hypothetical protein [Glycomyces sp. TRM65418]QZD57686.1 hypothetical protein K3N28_11510 [Glycomyces sp. TRM65418]
MTAANAEATVTALLAELGDEWATVEEITTARERLIDAIPGWRLPAAYGLGLRQESGEVAFAKTNVGEHPLPVVVMSTVIGHEGGSASFTVDAATLDQAIRLLAPAEACTAYEHPNLAAWRSVRQALDGGTDAVMVFVGDLNEKSDDADVEALRDIAKG